MVSGIDRLAKSGTKLGGVKTGGNNYRITDDLDFIDVSDGEWHTVRLLPGMLSLGQHWPDFTTKAGKVTNIPRPAHNWDIRTGTVDSTKEDPLYKHKDRFTSRGKEGTGFGVMYVVQCIDREMQEEKPAKTRVSEEEAETGIKVKGSKSWTPIKCLRLTRSVIEELQNLTKRNKPKGAKGPVDLDDLMMGRDVSIMYDANSKKPNKWSVGLGETPAGPLTKEERRYLVWDVFAALDKEHKKESLEDTRAWVKAQLALNKGGGSDDDEDEEEDVDDDLDLDEDDEDEDEAPARKKSSKSSKSSSKKSSSGKKRRVVEDDDEDEDDDDDDLDLGDDDDEEEEEVRPRKKKKLASGSSSSSKSRKAGKSSSSKSGKKRRSTEVDDDDVPF